MQTEEKYSTTSVLHSHTSARIAFNSLLIHHRCQFPDTTLLVYELYIAYTLFTFKDFVYPGTQAIELHTIGNTMSAAQYFFPSSIPRTVPFKKITFICNDYSLYEKCIRTPGNDTSYFTAACTNLTARKKGVRVLLSCFPVHTGFGGWLHMASDPRNVNVHSFKTVDVAQ